MKYEVFASKHKAQVGQWPVRGGEAMTSCRKLKSLVIILIATLSCTIHICAQPQSAKQSYNFTRALEEAKKGNKSEAMDFLTKEIAENPGNGYAHMTIAILQADAENYGDAMKSVNMAIKKLPKKDKEYVARAFASRAHLYTIAGDTIQALNDFNQAIKINPDDSDILETYGQLLYEMERYSDANDIYNRMVAANPTSVMGYMGLGRNAYASGNYDEAIRQYNIVIKMYDDYSSGYSFRAESYLKQGKYLEAVDDIMKSLSIDNDAKAHHYLFEFPDNQLTLVITKLRGMSVKNPHDAEWQYYIAQLYQSKKKCNEAIEAARKAFDIDAHPVFLEMIADCYQELGEYAQALEAITQAQQMRPDDLDLISSKADILGESGDIEGAITEWTRYVEKTPDFFGGYYRRGFFEDNSGQTDKALEDYDMAIMLNPDYAYSYLGKGDMLMRKGQTDEAMAAYRKVIELDTVPNNSSCAMYAFLALGERAKAVDFMEKVIANDSTDCGNYYDGACFYSRLGDLDKSLAHLRTAFEKGFRRFHHVMSDDDLESLRATDGFKSLMDEYTAIEEQETSVEPEQDQTSERVEIPFTPDGGCVSVKCSINELPLSFIFDTGASIVSLSQIEANFMLKNGYLKREDFVGFGRFVDANGDISEGTIVNLRDVDFGGLKLNNVRASVVRNQKAPLLLGQSVLGRLGSIEIDNPGKKLIITHSK